MRRIHRISSYLAIGLSLVAIISRTGSAENAAARQEQVVAYLKKKAAEVTPPTE